MLTIINTCNNQGLVAHYGLNEGIGTVAHDYSNNNNNATIVNLPSWTQGIYGNALSFNGNSSQYVESNISCSTTDYSVSAWMKFDDINHSYIAVGIGFGSGGVGTLWMGVFSNGTMTISNSSAGDDINGPLIDNNWHLYTGVVTGGNTLIAYIDSTFIGTSNVGVSARTSNTFIVGNYSTLSFPWYGEINEVRVYDKALTQSDINSIYNYRLTVLNSSNYNTVLT